MKKITKTNKASTTTKRFLISMPSHLLAAVDRQAQADCTSRSGFIRNALLEYLRIAKEQSQEKDLFTDHDELLRILQQRKLRHSVQRLRRDIVK